MKTILVPLDGSALAEQVLPYVRLFAPLLNANVRLMRVIETVERDIEVSDVLSSIYSTGETPERARARQEEALRRLRETVESYLSSHVMLLRSAGINASAEVYIGSPAEMIIDTAETLSPALIAMATHGYSGLKRWTLGSTTDKVVHATNTPVLIVRGQAQLSDKPPALRRLLVPQDGSVFARQALPIASELALRADAKLLLLEAIDPRSLPEPHRLARSQFELEELPLELMRQANTELNMLITGLRSKGIAARSIVHMGTAAETIVEHVIREHVDLVVMATHGYSGLQRWRLGSVADKVLHASTAPLLLVRPAGP